MWVTTKEGEDPSELFTLMVVFHVAEVPGAPAKGIVDEKWDEKTSCVDGVADASC